MSRLRKKRVRWSESTDSDVEGYRVYWVVGEGVGYDSDSTDVGNVTSIILPDDISSFPLIADEIELGVTAVNQAGNESDMTKFSTLFNFTAPEAPVGLVVEDVD